MPLHLPLCLRLGPMLLLGRWPWRWLRCREPCCSLNVARCRQRVAVCVGPMAFLDYVPQPTTTVCCCCWYLMLDFPFSNEMRLQMQFYIFQKSILSVVDRPEHTDTIPTRLAARDIQMFVCVCCFPVTYSEFTSPDSEKRQLVCTLSKLVFVPKWTRFVWPAGVENTLRCHSEFSLYHKRLYFRADPTAFISLFSLSFSAVLLQCFVCHPWRMGNVFQIVAVACALASHCSCILELWLWIDCQLFLLPNAACFPDQLRLVSVPQALYKFQRKYIKKKIVAEFYELLAQHWSQHQLSSPTTVVWPTFRLNFSRKPTICEAEPVKQVKEAYRWIKPPRQAHFNSIRPQAPTPHFNNHSNSSNNIKQHIHQLLTAANCKRWQLSVAVVLAFVASDRGRDSEIDWQLVKQQKINKNIAKICSCVGAATWSNIWPSSAA